MKQIPILFLGDSPDLTSGLARIGRDLASHLVGNERFRVGYLGRGGIGSSKVPFQCYNFPATEQWGEQVIGHVWSEFSRGERGVLFTIWDPSRLHWLADPSGLGEELEGFIRSGRFRKWGYFPIDSEGPGGKLSAVSSDTLRGFDRVLAYGQFGSGVATRTLGRDVNWIPHGFIGSTFTPRDRSAARMAMRWAAEETVVGMVATNQARKDWGCAFAAAAGLREVLPNFRFWVHVDVAERAHAWSIPALAVDFGFNQSNLTVTHVMSDLEMSYAYSACDATMLISTEGFGYPLVESMACGVPVVHGSYGGGAELVPEENRVVPVTFRLSTLHNCALPVFDPADWIAKVVEVVERERDPKLSESVSFLRWDNLWPVWQRFFEEGLGL